MIDTGPQEPGAVNCQHCPDHLARTDMVEHLMRQHPETLTSQAVAASDDDTAPGFHQWWLAQVDRAAPTIQRKAAEYGSNSLAEMGRMFARAQGRGRVEDAEALEIGCAVYAKGKLERVIDAMLKGKLPSADTWHDLGVYATMAQYIREHNTWP